MLCINIEGTGNDIFAGFKVRKTLHFFLSKKKYDDVYLLHCDMWGFDTKGKVINCGVQEPNMVNIASGLAYCGNKVIVYGVAGFVFTKRTSK